MVMQWPELDVEGFDQLIKAKLTVTEDRKYQFDWPKGDFVRIFKNGDWLMFDYLVSQNDKSRLKQLVAVVPKFFRDKGEVTHLATTSSGANEAMLEVGFQWERGYLLHEISENSRMEQYTAWKAGGDKPEWISDTKTE